MHSTLQTLRELKPTLLRRFGIEELAIFGSVARGQEHAGSDVDIAIMRMRSKKISLIFQAQDFLEQKLRRPVDINTFESIRLFIRKRIEQELVHV
jgi:predicted nucleotidyltransferase